MLPEKMLRKLRTRGAFQRNADARLQNAVAASDQSVASDRDRPVERMDRGADQLARHIARQLRVGIERDHITNLSQQRLVGRASQ